MRTVESSESLAIGSRDETSPQPLAPQPLAPRPTRTTDWTRKAVVVLCSYAALRILVFAAAFPMFNNVDEKFHFATIVAYAQGHLPGRELPPIGEELAKSMLPYFSQEYGMTLESMNRDRGSYARRVQALSQRVNFEAQGPPLYYLIAATWYNLGRIVGVQNVGLMYWVRFFNALSYGILVWLSYRFARRVYPENGFLCLAIPSLIAVFPQDVFYGMNRDVLSPTLWAGALLLMVDAIADEQRDDRCLPLASLLVGLGFLVELSNCVLYVALAGALLTWLHRSQTSQRHKAWVVSLSVVAAFLPPLLWMWRNYLVMGNLTGSRAKIQYFGWTMKPFTEIFHHPLFSFHGLTFFLTKLICSFWRGEYDWHGFPMRSVLADSFYVLSTVVFLFVLLLNFAWRRKALSSLQERVAWQALLTVGGSVLFLAVMSVVFDYHNYGYPSRAHPYFLSGRVISGALLPFAVMYASGLEGITRSLRQWIPPRAVLACLLLFITVSEIKVGSVVFSSPYNFFALLADRH